MIYTTLLRPKGRISCAVVPLSSCGGCLERARLLVATQFNNAYINLLIHDLAEKHLDGDKLTRKGEWLIGCCIRLFDPCLSCATH